MLRRVPSTSANVTRPRTSAVQWQSQHCHPQLPTSHTIGVPPRGSAGRAGCSPCSGSIWARGRVPDRVGQSSFDPRCLGARCRAWTRGSRCVQAEGLLRSRPSTSSQGQSALPAGPAWWVHPITRTCLVQSLPARPTQRGPARHSCVVPRSRLPRVLGSSKLCRPMNSATKQHRRSTALADHRWHLSSAESACGAHMDN